LLYEQPVIFCSHGKSAFEKTNKLRRFYINLIIIACNKYPCITWCM